MGACCSDLPVAKVPPVAVPLGQKPTESRFDRDRKLLEPRFATARTWLARAPPPEAPSKDNADLGAQALRLRVGRFRAVLRHMEPMLLHLVAAIQEESHWGRSVVTVVFQQDPTLKIPTVVRRVSPSYRVLLALDDQTLAKYPNGAPAALVWYFGVNNITVTVLHQSRKMLAVTCTIPSSVPVPVVRRLEAPPVEDRPPPYAPV